MVKKLVIRSFSVGGVLLLAGCNVGSDENQQPRATSGQTGVLSTQTAPVLKSGTGTNQADTVEPARSDVYDLVVHGVNSAGERFGDSMQFTRAVSSDQAKAVELTWFEPARAADGSCLRDLAGYDVVYRAEASSAEVSFSFDLASRDMVCTAVGSNECGDVRECRYTLAL